MAGNCRGESAVHGEGRPVLVGTRSVRDSETLSRRLEEIRLPHRVLNAVRHREEAGIVSLAGTPGAVTIATNMAGRGTDIRLGAGVAERGGLHVIVAECNESARIDRQLFGRAARQGDPGSARLYVSMEDEIVQRFIPRRRPVFHQRADAGRDCERKDCGSGSGPGCPGSCPAAGRGAPAFGIADGYVARRLPVLRPPRPALNRKR